MSHRSGRNPNRRLPAGHPGRADASTSQETPDMSRSAHKPSAKPKVPQITLKSRTAAPKRSYVGLFKDYLRLLLDLKFSRYLTVQLLPLLYVVLVIGGLGVIGQQVWDAFAQGPQRGLAYLAVSPFALLVWASACRATTEFLLVVFRMSEDVRTLASIKPTVDKLDNLFGGNNWISRLLPFLKAYQASRDDQQPPSTK